MCSMLYMRHVYVIIYANKDYYILILDEFVFLSEKRSIAGLKKNILPTNGKTFISHFQIQKKNLVFIL